MNVKIQIGSGNNHLSGWVNTQKHMLDVTNENHWKRLINRGYVIDNLLAEHVWEHLTNSERNFANRYCNKYLNKNGILRIAVPDGYFPNNEYINHTKPNKYNDHKILFNYKIIKEELELAGFYVNLLEYWDENLKFHHKEYSDKNGYIKRSLKNDIRNQNNEINYTSIILDAIKQ